MDVFSHLTLWGGGVTGWVIPFLFGLSVVVFFHELGHFLVARYCGVRVLTFSLGFGPEIAGFTDRRGTRWRISAIPLGGYVSMVGEGDTAAEEEGEEDPRSFKHKSVGQRMGIDPTGCTTFTQGRHETAIRGVVRVQGQ